MEFVLWETKGLLAESSELRAAIKHVTMRPLLDATQNYLT